MSELSDVHGAFQHRLSGLGRIVVAGGAVRDHLMGRPPKDYDIFLLGSDFDSQAGVVAGQLSGLEHVVPLDIHKSEPFLVATVKWNGAIVQVMSTPATTVDALIDTFDWNVCLFAFDGAFHAKEQIGNVGKGQSLKLHRVTYPLSTLRRGFRFSERYEMTLPRESVEQLCRDVLAASAPDAPAEAA